MPLEWNLPNKLLSWLIVIKFTDFLKRQRIHMLFIWELRMVRIGRKDKKARFQISSRLACKHRPIYLENISQLNAISKSNFIFFNDFLVWTLFKLFTEFFTTLLLFYAFVSLPQSCVIFAPWPGVKPSPPSLGGEILTIGPLGKSPQLHLLTQMCYSFSVLI